MIDLPSLYPHQEDLRDRTRAALAKHGRVILCAAPGVGKTRTSKWILGTSANRAPLPNQTGRSLFCVHRRGLVDNASDSFLEDPKLSHGVIMSGRDPRYGNRLQVASIDSLLSWFIEDDQYTTDITFDLIVFDECHSHHDKLARFLQYHDAKREALGQHPAYVIGLSATPQAKGLADVYKEIVLGPSTEWLIENKFLSPFRYFRGTQGKLGLLVKRGDEFTKDSEAAAMEGLAGELVRDWKKFADGRPTVGFFPRRSHAQDAVEQLEKAGLSVAYVDGDTDDDQRRAIFWDLNHGKINYLANVQVVERGTDIPRIGCVQLCVAVGSVVRYCLDEQTEVLTPSGWKDLNSNFLKCYQVTEDLKCSVVDVLDVFRRECSEPMWGIDGRSLDICVTEKHRMLIDWRNHGVEVCNSDEMPKEFKIPVSCFEEGPGVPLTDDEIRFVGLVATDGCINTKHTWAISISQSERHEECLEYIEDVLQGCGFRYGIYFRPFKGELAGTVPERHARREYTISFGDPLKMSDQHLRGWSRLIPWVSKNAGESMADVTREQLLVLLEAMQVGDGDKYKCPSIDWSPRTWRLAINDLEAAESLQSLCVRRGIRCNLSDNGCGCLVLLIDPTRQWWSVQCGTADARPQWGQRDYRSQRVWCVTVPSGFIIARRNGKPFIVGNCQMIGRGSRTADGKQDCIVLDHGGNIARHGFFEDPRHWSLDVSSKTVGESKTRPSIECPQCQAIYRGGRCKNCGYEPSSEERKGQGLEFDGTELAEVKEKKQPKVKSAEALMISALYIAGKSGRTWRQCCGIFNGMCKKQGSSYRIPSAVSVGGQRYQMPRWGSSDSGRKVGAIFPFTIQAGNHGGDYLETPQERQQPAF